MDVLDPYTGCRAMFAEFSKDIETHGNIKNLNARIEQVSQNITNYLSEHPSVKEFKSRAFEEEMTFINTSKFKSRKTAYSHENQDKLLISVDINKAYYTVLKHYYPDVFQNLNTWPEFVHTFCDDKPILTLNSSKSSRVTIFSKAGIRKKTQLLSEYFIRKILHDMMIPLDDVIMLSGDEFVISYERDMYNRLFNQYHGAFFKVLAFRLVKLPRYSYFVKEYFDPKDESVIISREFKCIPHFFLMQCIKKYEGKQILEADRKFMAEVDHVATFDESIFS